MSRRDLAKHAVTAVSLAVLAGALYYAFRYDRRAPGASQEDARGLLARTSRPTDGSSAEPARDEGALHPAPVNVFADASRGDWSAFRIQHKSSILDAGSTVLWEVVRVDADSVVVGGRGRLDTGEEKALRDMTFPRTGLTLERLLELDYGGWTILEAQSSEETHEVGGRTFACTKVVFSSSDPLYPDKKTETQIWFSPEVTGSGIVESREVQLLGELRFEITETIVGFGRADETTWGERPFPAGSAAQ